MDLQQRKLNKIEWDSIEIPVSIEEKNIFCARIIDRDSNGRWQLSARESVIDPKKWAKTLATTATSKEFMD
jgi:predicted RNA-binding protein with RPS1 domain